MQLVSVVIPTRGRPERVASVVERFNQVTDWTPLEIIVVCDGDREAFWALSEMQAEGWIVTPLLQRHRGSTEAWNLGLYASQGVYVVMLADDVWPEMGWLTEAMQVMRDELGGDGLVGLNGLNWPDFRLVNHYLLSRTFIKEHMGGVLAFPCYKHYFQDVEANERARRADKFAIAKAAIVRHDHPSVGLREADATDSLNAERGKRDHETFKHREQAGFPDDFEAVL